MDADVYLPGKPTCDTAGPDDVSQQVANVAFVRLVSNQTLEVAVGALAYGTIAGRTVGSSPLTETGAGPYVTEYQMMLSHAVFRYSGVPVEAGCSVSMGTTEGGDDIMPETSLAAMVDNTKQFVQTFSGLSRQLPPGANVYVNVTKASVGGGTSPGRGLFVVTLFGSYVF